MLGGVRVKNANKQTVVLYEAILFDDQLIDRVTFDLVHINQGWDEEKHDYAFARRSSYTADDVIYFFEQLRLYKIEWVLGENKNPITIRGRRYLRYRWDTSDEDGARVRLILDLPIRINGEGIIVTVFKV